MTIMLRDLYGHMEWADAVVWRAVLASDAAQTDQKLKALLVHLHTVQRAFLAIWSGEEAAIPDPSSFGSLREVAEWGRAYHRAVDVDAYGDPARIVDLPWSGYLTKRFGRIPASTTLEQTMLQVAMHSGYHRGQVNMRLRELGIEPPLVDFIAWLWLGRPKAEWPEADA